MAGWETSVRAQYDEMAVVRITPSWVKIIDFITRFPNAVDPARE